jgi:hypothetical protein
MGMARGYGWGMKAKAKAFVVWAFEKLAIGFMFVVLAPTMVAMFDGFGALLRQVTHWLKTGIWVPETVLDGLHKFGFERPSISWVIPRVVVDWLLGCPRSIGMFALGILILVVPVYALILLLFLVEKIVKDFKRDADA